MHAKPCSSVLQKGKKRKKRSEPWEKRLDEEAKRLEIHSINHYCAFENDEFPPLRPVFALYMMGKYGDIE